MQLQKQHLFSNNNKDRQQQQQQQKKQNNDNSNSYDRIDDNASILQVSFIRILRFLSTNLFNCKAFNITPRTFYARV